MNSASVIFSYRSGTRAVLFPPPVKQQSTTFGRRFRFLIISRSQLLLNLLVLLSRLAKTLAEQTRRGISQQIVEYFWCKRSASERLRPVSSSCRSVNIIYKLNVDVTFSILTIRSHHLLLAVTDRFRDNDSQNVERENRRAKIIRFVRE